MAKSSTEKKLEILQGTLDLIILQILAVEGTRHGYGIAMRLEEISAQKFSLNQGRVLRHGKPTR